jgi:hypothetical protein
MRARGAVQKYPFPLGRGERALRLFIITVQAEKIFARRSGDLHHQFFSAAGTGYLERLRGCFPLGNSPVEISPCSGHFVPPPLFDDVPKMQQPRVEAIKKPHKLKEPCGLFCPKTKLFSTYKSA